MSAPTRLLALRDDRCIAADTGPTRVEIRLRDLIVFERVNYSRYFELPIAIVAHLSSENESIPCAAKRDPKPFTSKIKNRRIDFREHGLPSDIAAKVIIEVHRVVPDITRVDFGNSEHPVMIF